MSAVRVPQEPNHDPKKDEGASSPAGTGLPSHVRYPEGKAGQSAHSPARQLQTELADRLQRPKQLSFRATLATVLVMCLSMSIAALSLITSH